MYNNNNIYIVCVCARRQYTMQKFYFLSNNMHIIISSFSFFHVEFFSFVFVHIHIVIFKHFDFIHRMDIFFCMILVKDMCNKQRSMPTQWTKRTERKQQAQVGGGVKPAIGKMHTLIIICSILLNALLTHEMMVAFFDSERAFINDNPSLCTNAYVMRKEIEK